MSTNTNTLQTNLIGRRARIRKSLLGNDPNEGRHGDIVAAHPLRDLEGFAVVIEFDDGRRDLAQFAGYPFTAHAIELINYEPEPVVKRAPVRLVGRCPECDGFGATGSTRLDYETCPLCEGTGLVE
jgi:hypothetical protein